MNREPLTFFNEKMTKATNLQFRKITLIPTWKMEREWQANAEARRQY